MVKAIAAGAALLMLCGCASRVVDFTAISTKNVHVAGAAGPRVTGEDCQPVFLGMTQAPNMETAIDRAIEAAGPQYNALTDGVVYRLDQSFLIGRDCYRVEGTPVAARD